RRGNRGAISSLAHEIMGCFFTAVYSWVVGGQFERWQPPFEDQVILVHVPGAALISVGFSASAFRPASVIRMRVISITRLPATTRWLCAVASPACTRRIICSAERPCARKIASV